MAVEFADSADRYLVGEGPSTGLSGVWATVTNAGVEIVQPSFGARTGTQCFLVKNAIDSDALRLASKGGALSSLFFACAVYFENLPQSNGSRIVFRTAANVTGVYLLFNPNGSISLCNASNTVLGTTAAGVLTASSWFFFEVRLVTGTGSAIFQMRDAAGTTIADFTGLTFASALEFVVFSAEVSGLFNNSFYIDDISLKSTTGSFQNTWYAAGGVGNYLLRPVADDPASAWSFQGRRIYELGVGDVQDATGISGFSTPDAAALELGSGDYTVEGTFRWKALPATGTRQMLLAKWRESTNERSWRLFEYESGGNYNLSLEITTNGTTGTLVVVHDFPFTPVLFTPYKIAVSRNSGTSRLYIDGVRVGPAVTDASAYFNGAAVLSVAARQNATSSLSEGFNGWIDEIRLTVGTGRYPTEYTPAANAFPRSATDPDWNNVRLLMGFENGEAIDQSQYGAAITIRGIALAADTDDGFFGYQSIDKNIRDDTFVQAALLPAAGTLEFVSNPTATSTVVAGVKTYTFVTSLGAANTVLIGVDTEASIDNLLNAINGGPGEGSTYGTGTTANADVTAFDLPGAIIEVEALIPGTAGNSIVFTTTVTGAVISGTGTLAGGANIPNPGIYILDRLPRGVTRIESVSTFVRRSVEGPGGATMQPSFIDSALAASNGADATAPANPAWQRDHFSSNGGNAWTISHLLGSKIQLNRTT